VLRSSTALTRSAAGTLGRPCFSSRPTKETGTCARQQRDRTGQGVKLTDNPFERLFVMPQGDAMSRYQHWKFQV
jgi:hypothetical protein